MQTYDSLFERVLAQLIEERVEHAKEALVSANFTDAASYRHAAGRVIGLREAIGLMDEAKAEIEKR